MALPLVSTLDMNLRYMVSQDNIDNMRDRYHYTYHWLAGTEVTEIQEKVVFVSVFVLVSGILLQKFVIPNLLKLENPKKSFYNSNLTSLFR